MRFRDTRSTCGSRVVLWMTDIHPDGASLLLWEGAELRLESHACCFRAFFAIAIEFFASAVSRVFVSDVTLRWLIDERLQKV